MQCNFLLMSRALLVQILSVSWSVNSTVKPNHHHVHKAPQSRRLLSSSGSERCQLLCRPSTQHGSYPGVLQLSRPLFLPVSLQYLGMNIRSLANGYASWLRLVSLSFFRRSGVYDFLGYMDTAIYLSSRMSNHLAVFNLTSTSWQWSWRTLNITTYVGPCRRVGLCITWESRFCYAS
jgi:hypothetical protein